jgi:Fur family transcriptional regulator, ferric uptake regulator
MKGEPSTENHRQKYRLTRQRRVILDELRKVHTHPSADEIYSMVRRHIPRISLGTVYRNLEILSEQGKIIKLSGGKQKRFDGNTGPHYHIRCLACDKVVDAPIDPIPTLNLQASRLAGFTITGHHIEFTGICPDCNT